RHTRSKRDWSSDVCSSDLQIEQDANNTFAIGNASGLLQSTGSLGGLNDSAEAPFHTTYLPGPTPGACTGGAGVAIPSGISDERRSEERRVGKGREPGGAQA